MRYEGLSLEDEKYLNMVNKLNALDLIKLEKSKEVELGLADSNFDYILLNLCEKQLTIIDTVLQVRALKN
jgi:hypothetical protein|tara:strand:- start:421 stop:630 length:210 start_codon:yes stop_codon:yes gene_type:complete